jgi:hypothetical protein
MQAHLDAGSVYLRLDFEFAGALSIEALRR